MLWLAQVLEGCTINFKWNQSTNHRSQNQHNRSQYRRSRHCTTWHRKSSMREHLQQQPWSWWLPQQPWLWSGQQLKRQRQPWSWWQLDFRAGHQSGETQKRQSDTPATQLILDVPPQSESAQPQPVSQKPSLYHVASQVQHEGAPPAAALVVVATVAPALVVVAPALIVVAAALVVVAARM
jgi:hypothetical protein